MDRKAFSHEDFAELRRQIASTTDFQRFWDYFFTDFVEQPGFLSMGQPRTLGGVREVLGTLAGYMMNRPEPVSPYALELLEVPGGIVHGSCLFDGRIGAVLYVPAIDMGMLAIMGAGGLMLYSRFVLQSAQEAQAVS